MHRPTLTLRRFGPMSFGLGYFENGIWVDHSGSTENNASQPDDMALDAVHRWYGCCGNSTATNIRASTIAHTERPSASVLALMPLAPARAVEK